MAPRQLESLPTSEFWVWICSVVLGHGDAVLNPGGGRCEPLLIDMH